MSSNNIKSDFRAPIKTLKTSWVQMAYTKPKKGAISIKRSLSSRATPIFKNNGVTTSLSQNFSY